MRVTINQVKRIIENCRGDADKEKEILRFIFSFPENIDTFSLYFFPDTIRGCVPAFHNDIYGALLSSKTLAWAAPRGHAKTTLTGVFTIWSVVYDRERYIVFVGQNHTKTTQFLDPVRHELVNNRLLNYVYDLKIGKAFDDQGRERADCLDVNGIRIEAVSFEKNMRGFKYRNTRPTLIIFDDFEDDQRVLNPELRMKDLSKVNRVILPSLDINGRAKFIGTILHHDCLLNQKIKQYGGFILKACERDFSNPLWPSRWSTERLKAEEINIGPVAFEQEYLNNPLENMASIIKRNWIEWCLHPELSLEEAQEQEYDAKVLGGDFAFSDRITANNTAFEGLGVNDSYVTIIHQELIKGWSIYEQMNHLCNSLQPRFNFDIIGLEENSIKSVSKDLQQFNLPIMLFWTGASDEAKKKKEVNFFGKRHTVGKVNLINRLGAGFYNKRFIIPYKTEADKQRAAQLIAECTSFALSDGKLVEAGIHPDLPIALGYALEAADKFKGQKVDFEVM